MLDTIKIYWKLIVTVTIAVTIMTLGIVSYINSSRVNKKLVKAQIELVEKERLIKNLQQEVRESSFNSKIDSIEEVSINPQEKISNEIKESITNPTIDFSNRIIQDSIRARANRRFFK